MSDYPAFDVKIDNDDGSFTAVPLQTINIWNITDDETLGTVASDAEGHVAGGSLAIDAGTVVRFSFNKENGICGYSEVVTT